MAAAGAGPVEAAAILARVERNELAGAYSIWVIDPETHETKAITVAEILADPATYDGCQTLDPVDPDYNNRSIVGRLFLDGAASVLNSFAHGGTAYTLLNGADDITCSATIWVRAALPRLNYSRRSCRCIIRNVPDAVLSGGRHEADQYGNER